MVVTSWCVLAYLVIFRFYLKIDEQVEMSGLRHLSDELYESPVSRGRDIYIYIYMSG